MNTSPSDTALLAALDTARAEGRTVTRLKDLLCDACGASLAVRNGYCAPCDDDMAAHYAATVEAHSMAAHDGAARLAAMYDDPESCAQLAGLHPGKC